MITAAQVASNIAGLNARTRPEVPAFLVKEAASKPKVHIYNTYPLSWRRSLGGLGSFTIPACEDHGSNRPSDWEKYSKPLIIDSIIFELYDLGEGKSAWNYWDGKDVARDVTGESSGISQNDLGHWGVFIAAGTTPTEAELALAKKKLIITMTKLLHKGDALWAGTQTERNQLSNHHRKAATYLGVQRSWDSTVQVMEPCPFCGSPVAPNLAKCKSCGSVLNRELWNKGQEGYVEPAPADLAPGLDPAIIATTKAIHGKR